jgi:hypothetical protein
LKAIVEMFAQSTELRVNHGKSCMVPQNMDKEQVMNLAGVFGCKLQDMPFTYLGHPMGSTKAIIEHFCCCFLCQKIIVWSRSHVSSSEVVSLTTSTH